MQAKSVQAGWMVWDSISSCPSPLMFVEASQVELLLPSGELRQRRLHLSLKAGSRAVADPGRPGHLRPGVGTFYDQKAVEGVWGESKDACLCLL